MEAQALLEPTKYAKKKAAVAAAKALLEKPDGATEEELANARQLVKWDADKKAAHAAWKAERWKERTSKERTSDDESEECFMVVTHNDMGEEAHCQLYRFQNLVHKLASNRLA